MRPSTTITTDPSPAVGGPCEWDVAFSHRRLLACTHCGERARSLVLCGEMVSGHCLRCGQLLVDVLGAELVSRRRGRRPRW